MEKLQGDPAIPKSLWGVLSWGQVGDEEEWVKQDKLRKENRSTVKKEKDGRKRKKRRMPHMTMVDPNETPVR